MRALHLLAVLCCAPALAAPSALAAEPGGDAAMEFTLSVDPRLRPAMGAEDFLTAARLLYWAKDASLGRVLDDSGAPGALLAVERLAELVLLDFPLAQESQVFPHEIVGHGGRVRELGGKATFGIELPVPYSFLTRNATGGGGARWRFNRPLTRDEQLLIYQGGMAVESAQRLLLLDEVELSQQWSHGDEMVYLLLGLHSLSQAYNGTDRATWIGLQAEAGRDSSTQRSSQFLAATAVLELFDPNFLFCLYALFWRYLVMGERVVAAPSIPLPRSRLSLTTHLDPVPWGMEGAVAATLGLKDFSLRLTPRYGSGPGGSSMGLDVAGSGLRVGPLRLAAEVDLWVQPVLDVVSERTPVGGPGRVGQSRAGVMARVEVDYLLPRWLVGVRAGAKTAGLSGVWPVAPAFEAVAVFGLRAP
jgi:hypothetical protein